MTLIYPLCLCRYIHLSPHVYDVICNCCVCVCASFYCVYVFHSVCVCVCVPCVSVLALLSVGVRVCFAAPLLGISNENLIIILISCLRTSVTLNGSTPSFVWKCGIRTEFKGIATC